MTAQGAVGPAEAVPDHIEDGAGLIVSLANGEPSCETLFPGKVVTTFAFGTTQLDDVLHENGRYWSSSGGQADFGRGAMYL